MLKELKLAEGSVEGAVERAFIAQQQFERLVTPLEDVSETLVIVLSSPDVAVRSIGVGQFVGQQVGLNVGDAAQTPARDGHAFDQIHLDWIGGLEPLDVGRQQGLVIFGGLRGQHDGFAGEAVAQAVGSGLGLACRRGGALRFGSVGFGGCGFGCRHEIAPSREG